MALFEILQFLEILLDCLRIVYFWHGSIMPSTKRNGITISKLLRRSDIIFGTPKEEVPMSEQNPLPIIWRTPDELWEIIEPILKEHDPPKNTGRPCVDQRETLDAIIFRMRSGCQWNLLPKEFPDDSSVPIAPSRGGLSRACWS